MWLVNDRLNHRMGGNSCCAKLVHSYWKTERRNRFEHISVSTHWHSALAVHLRGQNNSRDAEYRPEFFLLPFLISTRVGGSLLSCGLSGPTPLRSCHFTRARVLFGVSAARFDVCLSLGGGCVQTRTWAAAAWGLRRFILFVAQPPWSVGQRRGPGLAVVWFRLQCLTEVNVTLTVVWFRLQCPWLRLKWHCGAIQTSVSPTEVKVTLWCDSDFGVWLRLMWHWLWCDSDFGVWLRLKWHWLWCDSDFGVC